MSKRSKILITFVISFIIAFFIVGYVNNAMFVKIYWGEDATVWHKFYEYYIRTFSSNIILTLIISIIFTSIISLVVKNKN